MIRDRARLLWVSMRAFVKQRKRLGTFTSFCRVLRFFPRHIRLGSWDVDYGSGRYLTWTRPFRVPLRVLTFDARATQEMREVQIANFPTEKFSSLLRSRYAIDLSEDFVLSRFLRLKALLASSPNFTVCVSVDSAGKLQVIDGSHRCAAALMAGEESIYVVVGVRKRHWIAEAMARIAPSYP